MKLEIADGIIKRSLGLMLRKDGIMVFVMPGERRWSIWSAFMLFDIDMFFFDNQKNLIEKSSLKKWSFYIPKKPFMYLIECRKGTLKKEVAKRLLKSI